MSELISEADLSPARQAPGDASAPLSLGAICWSIFEGARNPYVILITIYIFMPYFAAVVVGDPVRGQEAVAAYGQYSGWIVMVTAPFLGASVDRIGRRKPLLALIVLVMVPMIWSLWWTKPDHTGLSINAVIALATAIGVLFSYTEVLHNSLLVRAAGLSGAHKASGLALALGNAFALGALGFVAWAFALPGKVAWSFIPKGPLFGLDALSHQPDRIVAPLAAAIFALGAIPLFLFTPDAEPTGVPFVTALRGGAAALWRMVANMRGYRDAAIFLIARMFYVDGMTAVLLFAGVYARGVMHWGALEMLFYGMLLTVLAVLGGFVGGALDSRLGPKRAVQIEIGATLVGIVAFLGMSPTRILYAWAYDPATHAVLWRGPMFRTLPEAIFILIGFSNALFITAHYASSRTLLTRLTPPEQTGAFFGVYALSGTATVWLGSFLVNLGTHIFKTQQGGFASIALLLALGFVGLLFVRGGDPCGQGVSAPTDPVMAAILAAIAQLHGGDRSGGRSRLEAVWSEIADDPEPFHECVLSHYLADAQNDPADELAWDLRALDAASRCTDIEARRHQAGFSIPALMPSLHANLAEDYFKLGDLERSRTHLAAARGFSDALADDAYGQLIRRGIERLARQLGDDA